MPCSPVTVPPRRSARSKRSPAASSARARGASSPGVEQERSVQVAVARVAPRARLEVVARADRDALVDRLGRRSSGTAMSSESFAAARAATACEMPARQRHTAGDPGSVLRRVHATAPSASASTSSPRTRAPPPPSRQPRRARRSRSTPRRAAANGADRRRRQERSVAPRRTRAPPARCPRPSTRAIAAQPAAGPARVASTGSCASGAGIRRSHAAVTIPSVPSEPHSSARRS